MKSETGINNLSAEVNLTKKRERIHLKKSEKKYRNYKQNYQEINGSAAFSI
jgi:hypothetical protein